MANQNQSLKAKARNGGRWTATSAIASVVLQVAQLAILGRLLAPSEFGLMAMMMVVIGLTNSIADFGLGNYLVQKETLSKKTLVQLLIIVSGMATLLAVIVALSASPIASYYKQPLLVELLPWLSVSIVAYTFSQMLMSILQRFFAFREIATGEIISGSLTLVSTTILAMSGYGVWSLVIGQIVVGSVRAFFFAIQLSQYIKHLPRLDHAKLKDAGGFIFYQTGERALNYFGANLDKVIIGRMLGDASLGIYSIVYQLMVKPYIVLNPIFTRVAFPLFVSIRDDNVRLSNEYLQMVKITAFMMFPIYMVIVICAPGIITILMGEKWIEASPILYVLGFVGMFFSIGNPIGTLILAKSKPHIAFYFNALSILIYAFAFWVGSHYSIFGVAVAFLISVICILYPIEFYIRFKLVEMRVAHYFQVMRNIFIAAAVPIFGHGTLKIFQIDTSTVACQFTMASLSIAFFYGYLYIYDRDLIKQVSGIISNDSRQYKN